MSLIKYYAFVKTVDRGSITAAAEDLGYSQSGISRMLDSLEDEVGLQLIVRKGRHVEPTEDGRAIYVCCKNICKQGDNLSELSASLRGMLYGKIRISSLNSMLVEVVPSVVERFSRTYPNIELAIKEEAFPETLDNLLDNNADVGFISEFSRKGLIFHPLFEDTLCLVMHKDHPFANYDKIPTRLLNGCDVIIGPHGWDDRTLLVRSKSSFKPVVKPYMGSDAGAFALVSRNLGLYITSGYAAKLVPDNVLVKPFEEDYTRYMGIAVRDNKKYETPAIDEFIRIARSVVPESV